MPTIKRYANRKLYDTEARKYITLEGIADLIHAGKEVHVVDHATGEDLTAQTQAQIIFEREKRWGSNVPRAVLTNLIQAGNQLRTVLARPAVDEEIERRMMALIEESAITEADGLALLEKLLGVKDPAPIAPLPTAQDIEHILETRGIPTRSDLHRLAQQVETLAAELENLTKR